MRVLFDGYSWFDGPPAGIVITHEKTAARRREFHDNVLTVALRRSPSPEEASDLERQGVRWVRTYLPAQRLKNMAELSLQVRFGPYNVAWGSNYSPLLGKSAVFVHGQSCHRPSDRLGRGCDAYFAPRNLRWPPRSMLR